MPELTEQIKVVHKVRQALSELKALKNERMLEWEDHNRALLDQIEDAGQSVNEAEGLLRQLTIEAFKATGSKQPAPGVGIREGSTLKYDANIAFNWAVEHRIALKLDTAAFEKVAQASKIEFVEVIPETTATIAKDLSKYVEEENAVPEEKVS